MTTLQGLLLLLRDLFLGNRQPATTYWYDGSEISRSEYEALERTMVLPEGF